MFQEDIRDESMQPYSYMTQNYTICVGLIRSHTYVSGNTVPLIVSLCQVIDDVQVASSESRMELLHLI